MPENNGADADGHNGNDDDNHASDNHRDDDADDNNAEHHDDGNHDDHDNNTATTTTVTTTTKTTPTTTDAPGTKASPAPKALLSAAKAAGLAAFYSTEKRRGARGKRRDSTEKQSAKSTMEQIIKPKTSSKTSY